QGRRRQRHRGQLYAAKVINQCLLRGSAGGHNSVVPGARNGKSTVFGILTKGKELAKPQAGKRTGTAGAVALVTAAAKAACPRVPRAVEAAGAPAASAAGRGAGPSPGVGGPAAPGFVARPRGLPCLPSVPPAACRPPG